MVCRPAVKMVRITSSKERAKARGAMIQGARTGGAYAIHQCQWGAVVTPAATPMLPAA